MGINTARKLTRPQTTELTRLQVGDNETSPVNIVVSTLVEAENIIPLLEEYKSKGREVNVSAIKPQTPGYY